MTGAYRFEPMTRGRAARIADWHYEEPYSFYDMESDPNDLAEFLDPVNWADSHFTVHREGELAGFATFDAADGRVTVGLGMKPELTGRGAGAGFLDACLDFAAKRYAPEEFALSVATFNERAITVYKRAGFERVGTRMAETNGGEYEFLDMRKPIEDR